VTPQMSEQIRLPLAQVGFTVTGVHTTTDQNLFKIN